MHRGPEACYLSGENVMERRSPEERYAEVQRNLTARADAALLDRHLSGWVVSTDRHLPQSFLRRTLRDIIALSYDELLETHGLGDRRIGKLIGVLERACLQQEPASPTARECTLVPSPSGVLPAVVQPISPDKLTEPDWLAWRHAVRAHGLEQENLGRFAGSLSDLPQGLWSVPLIEYADRPLYEIKTMAGHGPARVGQILDVFYRIAQTIASCPADTPLAIRLLPPLVRDALLWTERILHEQAVPSVADIRESFLKPLFTLLETDMGAETAAIVRRRIGLDGPAETLEQIANDISLTRERVRQITLKAVHVTRVRWPEGKFILDNVYAHFQASPGCDEQLDLMHAVLDTCFALEVTRGGSRSDVLTAWDRAGKAKRTPMNEAAVRAWASGEFPDLPSDVIRRWLEEEGLRHAKPDGGALFFSNDPLDKLLRHLHVHSEPLPIGELSDFVDGDERSIRNRVDRDPRFIEDEFKRVLPAEQCSFFRNEGRWFLRTEPVQGIDQRAETVALSDLIHMIVGGLVQAGVCDATVWGVHRFTCSLLRRVYGASLASSVTPFVLAGTLVRHSDGIVRHMRRRRLRWDSADGSIPVRGKRGWVDHLATVARVPMTFDELDAALRGSFQDYESYVLKQLNLDEEEEGESSYGCQYIPGVSHVVPAILIPRGWKLDLGAVNISEGVRLAVVKIVSMSTRSPFPKAYLRRLPWMVQLCEHTAFGNMRWEERVVDLEESASEPDADATPVAPPPAAETKPPEGEPNAAAAVDDLLSRFL